MKKKVTVIDHGTMVFTLKENMVKCELFEGYLSSKLAATFYVPRDSYDKISVPSDIVKYRLKHDFNIEIGHYSVTNKIEH